MIRGIFSPKKIKAWILNLRGITSRRYAYKGPDVVQIDCTDRCNSNCFACWTHSTLIKNNKDSGFKDIDPEVLKNFIREVNKSGTREICFSGGGEPFIYPWIWEILDFTERIGLLFRINTNFTLVNKENIKKLLSYERLASLTVSIWAPDADLYSKLHGRSAECFYNVKNNLIFLNNLKTPRLNVGIYSVVTNMNYLALEGLMNLAIETGCNGVEFALVDAMPGSTDILLLNKDQLCHLKSNFFGLASKGDKLYNNVSIINKDLFLKRILSPGASFGEYDISVDQKPCYSGWTFLRIRANGDVNSCLKSHRIPIGNIYKESFLSIWNNGLQQEFRKECLSMPRDKEYFKAMGNGNDGKIGCRRSCDNVLINEHAYKIARCLIRN